MGKCGIHMKLRDKTERAKRRAQNKNYGRFQNKALVREGWNEHYGGVQKWMEYTLNEHVDWLSQVTVRRWKHNCSDFSKLSCMTKNNPT